MKRGLVFSVVLALLVIPLISALGYYSNPIDYLNDEWVKFGIIFILLFAAMYSFINKRMQNTSISAIIAAGLSALISIPIMQRGLIDPFLSPGIVDWTVIIAFGLMFIFFFYKFGMRVDDYGRRRFSVAGLIIFLAILMFIVYLIGDYLPESVTYGPVGDSLDWIKSLSWTLIIIVISILIIGWLWRRHQVKRGYLWKGRYEQRGKQGGGWFGGGKKQAETFEGGTGI